MTESLLKLSSGWGGVVFALIAFLIGLGLQQMTGLWNVQKDNAVIEEKYNAIRESQLRLESKADAMLKQLNQWGPRMSRLEVEVDHLETRVNKLESFHEVR